MREGAHPGHNAPIPAQLTFTEARYAPAACRRRAGVFRTVRAGTARGG